MEDLTSHICILFYLILQDLELIYSIILLVIFIYNDIGNLISTDAVDSVEEILHQPSHLD